MGFFVTFIVCCLLVLIHDMPRDKTTDAFDTRAFLDHVLLPYAHGRVNSASDCVRAVELSTSRQTFGNDASF